MLPNSRSCHLSSSSSKRPVGWHFEPRGREVKYFLEEKKKNPEFSYQPIVTCNIYEFNPDELARMYQVEKENMYFFTQLNLQHYGGWRVNRQAEGGFWVSSDGYKHVEDQGNSLGYKMMTLNFFEGVKPNQMKTDWLMKEYMLDEVKPPTVETTTEGCGQKHDWKRKRVAETQKDNPKKMKKYVLCQIYEKCKAKKTTNDPTDEVITECLATTPGMLINSQGGTHTGRALEDHITPDQTNNRNEYLPDTPGTSQDETFADLGYIIMSPDPSDQQLNF